MTQMCSSGFDHVVCHHCFDEESWKLYETACARGYGIFVLCISSIMLRSHRVHVVFFWPVVEVLSAVFSRARLIASGAQVITSGCCHFFFVYTAGTFKRMCCYFHLVSRSVWRSARSAAAIISIGLTPRASWVSSICCSGPRASQIPHQNTARCQLKTDRLLSARVRWTQSKRPR